MAIKLSDTVESVLKQNPDKYYTARQLAEWIWNNKKEECFSEDEKK